LVPSEDTATNVLFPKVMDSQLFASAADFAVQL